MSIRKTTGNALALHSLAALGSAKEIKTLSYRKAEAIESLDDCW